MTSVEVERVTVRTLLSPMNKHYLNIPGQALALHLCCCEAVVATGCNAYLSACKQLLSEQRRTCIDCRCCPMIVSSMPFFTQAKLNQSITAVVDFPRLPDTCCCKETLLGRSRS
ncbi:hypothetical protein ABBQ32_003076 [Trebouxia sp. C0010 RCD-2024]